MRYAWVTSEKHYLSLSIHARTVTLGTLRRDEGNMKNKVYYDESCYVCSLEINAVRKRGESCGIEFVDISNKDFDPGDEDFETEMIGEFDGKKSVGIETFRLMYEKMGFKKSVAFSRLPIIKQLFDSGYYVFAHWIRPYLPKK